jgi:hypothetical protein
MRVTFEETADIYDEIALDYPVELVRDILSLSEIFSKKYFGDWIWSRKRNGLICQTWLQNTGHRVGKTPGSIGCQKVSFISPSQYPEPRTIHNVYQEMAPQFLNPDKRFTPE